MLNLKYLPGIFLSVEGPEFSGKSTIIRKFEELYKDAFKIQTTREPGSTERGKIIREWVTNPVGAFADNHNLRAMGFAMDRSIHIHELIVPRLTEGYLVLTDRYIDSSYVLQGIIQGKPIEEINFCNLLANGITDINLMLPEKTIYIDINEETALERHKSRGNENLMDIEFMPRFNDIRTAYLELARQNPERYIVINGNKTIDEVLKDFSEEVMNIMKKNKPEQVKI